VALARASPMAPKGMPRTVSAVSSDYEMPAVQGRFLDQGAGLAVPGAGAAALGHPPGIIVPPDLDYAAEYRRALATNVAVVQAEVALVQAGKGTLSPLLMAKVAKFSGKTGYSRASVFSALVSCEQFAATFAKDPVKQSIHEKLAARHLRTMEGLVEGFEKLSSTRGSAGSWYLGDDGTLSNAETSSVKSMDFTWTTGSWRVFALHKYTNEEGGGQDHQWEEAKRFVAAATQAPLLADCFSTRSPVALFAICDGPYYQNAKKGRKSRLEEMQAQAGDSLRVYVGHINGVAAQLHKLLMLDPHEAEELERDR
jgi:hypothetical protein